MTVVLTIATVILNIVTIVLNIEAAFVEITTELLGFVTVKLYKRIVMRVAAFRDGGGLLCKILILIFDQSQAQETTTPSCRYSTWGCHSSFGMGKKLSAPNLAALVNEGRFVL
jgi:hypothetical protein